MLSKLMNVLSVVAARTGRPEPVIKRAQVVAVVAAVVSQAAMFGVHVSDGAQGWLVRGIMAVLAISPFVAAFTGRNHVTSLDDPRDHDGAPLTRIPTGHVVVPVGAVANDVAGTVADAGIGAVGTVGTLAADLKDTAGDIVQGVTGLLHHDPSHDESA